MKRRVDNEPAFVLHSYPYKETSLVLEVLSRRHGRIGLLARGARRPRSAMRGLLLAFQPLSLGWSGSTELGTLMKAEWSGGESALSGAGLMCGFYLNELLLRLLPRDDPHESLFEVYGEALRQLSQGIPQASVLRSFEKRLLAELGYAPLLEREAVSGEPIQPSRRYVYEPDRGPMPSLGASSNDLSVSGQTLLDLAADEFSRPETRDEARMLLRSLIGQRLHGKVLHTRAVLRELNDL
jgi:DNA repair protein RecO (recombination protein O)